MAHQLRSHADAPHRCCRWLLAALLGLAPAVSQAAESPRNWALTVSLADLVQPMYSAKLQYALAQPWSVALKAGATSYPTAHLDSLTIFSLGAQGYYHLNRDMERGVQAVIDLEYAHSIIESPGIAGSGDRLRSAALLAAKWTGALGFVGELQFGYGLAHSEVRSVGGTERVGVTWLHGPRGDIRIGYAF